MEEAHPSSVENKDDNLVGFRLLYTPLEDLFAFAQLFLDFQCSGLNFPARGSSTILNKGLTAHRPLILENEAKRVGGFSFLAPLLENMFAFAQLGVHLQCGSGLEMTGRGGCISPDKGLEGSRPLNGENEVNYLGEFSPTRPCSEDVFAFAQISFDFQCRGLKGTAQVYTITHNEDLERNDPRIV